MKTTAWCFSGALLMSVSSLHAQTQSQSSPEPRRGSQVIDLLDARLHAGGLLTGPVRSALKLQIANEFEVGANAAGFSRAEAEAFSQAIRFGQIRAVPGGSLGRVIAIGPGIPNPNPATLNAGTAKFQYLNSYITVQKVSAYLERFSTIKLVVNPAPPRDYLVHINGELCDSTNEGVYKVLPGAAHISVTRPNTKACEWSGTLAPGQTHQQACQL